MRLQLHLGIPGTGTKEIVESLTQGETQVTANRCFRPAPRYLRRTVRSILNDLQGMPPIEEEQKHLFDKLTPDGFSSKFDKAIFAEETWVGSIRDAFEGASPFDAAGEEVTRISELFDDKDLSLSLSLRNPAVYLHNVQSWPKMKQTVETYLSRSSLKDITWQPMLQSIRQAVPDVPLTIWAYEDRLLIWPRLLRALGAGQLDCSQQGLLAPFAPALEAEGLERLQTYLAKHPPKTDLQFEKTVLVFLDKYGREEAFDETVDLTGWDSGMIEAVTERYEADLQDLSEEDGVTVLFPETLLEDA